MPSLPSRMRRWERLLRGKRRDKSEEKTAKGWRKWGNKDWREAIIRARGTRKTDRLEPATVLRIRLSHGISLSVFPVPLAVHCGVPTVLVFYAPSQQLAVSGRESPFRRAKTSPNRAPYPRWPGGEGGGKGTASIFRSLHLRLSDRPSPSPIEKTCSTADRPRRLGR